MKTSYSLQEYLCLSLLALAIVPPLAAVIYIFVRAAGGISVQFLTTMPQQRGISGGILPAIMGTIWLMVGTAMAVLPIGVGAGIYLAEFAPNNRFTRLLEMALINLSGVPSVVFGLFGYALFVVILGFGSSLLSASLTLAALTLPLVVTATRQALNVVPRSFRDASLALGATKWQSVSTVILPCAKGGILTGTLLGLSRAAGETAPILITGVAFYLPSLPRSFLSRFMALPYHLFITATQVPGMPQERVWATAGVLLFLILTMQVGATFWREKERMLKKW
ncbi:MAG: phosphate transport system permease protein [Bacillota bacterium]|nr:MAG: phosphate transport system permease protein [Bacillota bacterium]MBS3949272.1 phosphate ABC transporter permease PstA [Peptococcaceae bacterium]